MDRFAPLPLWFAARKFPCRDRLTEILFLPRWLMSGHQRPVSGLANHWT